MNPLQVARKYRISIREARDLISVAQRLGWTIEEVWAEAEVNRLEGMMC